MRSFGFGTKINDLRILFPREHQKSKQERGQGPPWLVSDDDQLRPLPFPLLHPRATFFCLSVVLYTPLAMKLSLSFFLALCAALSSAHRVSFKKIKHSQPFQRRADSATDSQVNVDAESSADNSFDLKYVLRPDEIRKALKPPVALYMT